ncbi:glycosyltransferase family 2 protein [Parvicella tangerina]|uniref:Glycosyltransferase 2-like domain-containing protein n=1 Tax=Parvicella tangerina TaxID=2829795 RepID=A0A916JNA4_9FLAO|nr:glycosyltransferase [Parvicella tangerina]CAG5084291.1 hypothetical protein CRYO30217_02428 [Parvicella tangerina]
MKEETKISVIIAVYNGEKTIEKSIESVLLQEHRNFELIVVNDGSTDDTVNKVNNFSDERLRLVNLTSNHGVSEARNRGLELMTGSFFCFLDADDVFPIDSLSSRLRVFLENENIRFVDGAVEQRLLSTNELVDEYMPDYYGNPLKELLLLTGTCFLGQTWMIRNDFSNLPKFDPQLTHGEDLLFLIDCAVQGGEYSFVRNKVLTYYRHDNSAMTNVKGLELYYKKHMSLLDKYCLNGVITRSDKKKTRQKIRCILFKSYLKRKLVLEALKSLVIK